MTFIQNQRFFSTYKNFYPSFYRTIPYFKFSSQHFDTSNFILSNFSTGPCQFSIKNLKPKTSIPCLHKRGGDLKMYFQFKQFSCSNFLKIQNIIVPFKLINQTYCSWYFMVNKTYHVNKKWYQTIKNFQLENSFFCKQSFWRKNIHLKKPRQETVKIIFQKKNLFSFYNYEKYLVTRALNLHLNQQIRQLQFCRITFMFWNQYKNMNMSILFRIQKKVNSTLKGKNCNLFLIDNQFLNKNHKSKSFKSSNINRIQNISSLSIFSFLDLQNVYSKKAKLNIFKSRCTNILFDNHQKEHGRVWNIPNKVFEKAKNQKTGLGYIHLNTVLGNSLKAFISAGSGYKNMGMLNLSRLGRESIFIFRQKQPCILAFQTYDKKWNYQFNMTIQNFIIPFKETHISILVKRQRFISNSLKGILLVNFPEKEKNFLIKHLAAENKIALITQSASLLLKDSRNMDDLLGVDDPIQILFDKVKNCIPCICFINNLDSIGKQRYEQEQKSLHWLNNSISLLIDDRFKNHRVPKSINQEKKFTLATNVLFHKTFVSVFDDDFKKRAILKNLNSFQWPRRETSLFKVDSVKDRYSFSFQARPLKNLIKTTKKKWLTSTPSNITKDFTSFFSILFDKRSNLYYSHRLPLWLLTNRFFPKHNIDIARIKPHRIFGFQTCLESNHYNKKRLACFFGNTLTSERWLFNSLDYSKKKARLKSIKSGINLLPLHMVFSKSLASPEPEGIYKKETRDTFQYVENYDVNKTYLNIEKPESKIINTKTNFENPGAIYTKRFFKNSFLESNSNEIFQNKLKNFSGSACRFTPVSFVPKPTKCVNFVPKPTKYGKAMGWSPKINTHYPTSAKRKPSFQNLGKIDKTKISLMDLNLSRQSIKNNAQKQRTFELLVSSEKERNKNDPFKITETEIIKRTALLKFLQILDGFHTTTGKRKQSSALKSVFPDLNIFRLNTKKVSMYKLALTLQKKNVHALPFVSLQEFFNSIDCPQKTRYAKPWSERWWGKSFKLNLNQKNSLFLKNFLTPLVLLKKPEKSNNAIILPAMQNQIGFPKINRFKKDPAEKLKKTFKFNIDGPSMVYKNNFFEHVLKKIRSPISFINGESKWKIYLKNQPSIKSLNLLCVWPLYMEEILGSLNSNDGASYLLPDYFQLLGHGLKLKKQGITLIASTHNLTTLDAALLRPGRFDTIINFSHSSLSIDKFYPMLKHSPSLIQDNQFSLQFYVQEKNLSVFEKSLPPTLSSRESKLVSATNKSENIDGSVFSKNSPSTHQKLKSLLKKRKISNVFVQSFNFDQKLIKKEKEKNNLFLFNNAEILLSWSVPSMKISISKRLKNFFYSQVTILDIPNQSIPIKTFIDVSIFIQYKLWWSFNNEKLLWFRLHQKNLIQQEETGISKFKQFKIFKGPAEKLTINNVVSIIKSNFYQIKDLPYIFIGILQIIYFRFFYIVFQFFIMLKSKYVSFQTYMVQGQTFKDNSSFSFLNQTKSEKKPLIYKPSQIEQDRKGFSSTLVKSPHRKNTKLTSETSIKQKYNSVNNLGREILISKAVTDFRLSLSFGSHPIALHGVKRQAEPENLNDNLNQNYDTNFLVSLKNQSSTWTLTKKLDLLNSFLDKYYVSKNKAWMLPNLKNQTIKNFNFHIKHEHMFFKSNRSLLFWIGDFDYKTDFEKDFDINLVFGPPKIPWVKRLNHGRLSVLHSLKRRVLIGETFKSWNKKQGSSLGDFLLTSQKKTNNIRQFQGTNLMNHKKVLNNYFNTDTIKTVLKPQCQDFYKSIKVATAFLDQPAKIWKDSEDALAIKNVNITTSLLTKYNEIYRLKKIKLKQSFFNLHALTRVMLGRCLELTKPNKLKQHLKFPLINIGLSNYSNDNYQKTNNLRENDDLINVNVKKQLNFSLYKKNVSVIQDSCFSNLHVRSLHNHIYHNLYSVTLLVPINSSLSKKKELFKTLTANSFFSSYESYLFKQLSTNSSLNIRCLQIDPNLIDSKKNIDISGLVQNRSVFSNKKDNLETEKFSSIHLLQTRNRLKTIPRKTVTTNTSTIFQTPYKFKCFNAPIDQLKMENNIILLKNFALLNSTTLLGGEAFLGHRLLNKKKEHNFIETDKSPFQRYKMCRLDLSFFLLIFYTIFFEKIQHKKITLNTIKIFMPYQSFIFSHFLLSQGETYNFSCKNFEILIYNKFKNFLVDF